MKPVDQGALVDRLTVLWLAMGHAKGTDQAKAWLHELTRLLQDLPGEILFEAIDDAVKQSDRGFLPSVGAIRSIAEPMAEQRRRKAARLDAMARLQESGAQIKPAPHAEPAKDREPSADQPMTDAEAAEMNAILARVGASTRYRPDGRRYEAEGERATSRRATGPARNPTREDYLEMGVDPAVFEGKSEAAAVDGETMEAGQ